MKFIYNILLIISEKLIYLFGNFFGHKVKLFAKGQKNVFKKLKSCELQNHEVIWFHVSSLGEYEQALPVMEKISTEYPKYRLLLSFFSPSGYEIKKDSSPADCVVYLPIDNKKNVRKFLDIVKPKMVFFVKYDFWPNYLYELKNRKITTYLISGLFTEKHKFFKWFNGWLKKSLSAFDIFFVQDEHSKNILNTKGFNSVIVAGDTRFDRVFSIAKEFKNLEFIENFKTDKDLFIAGSTWEIGEKMIGNFLKNNKGFKTIIAPHVVSNKHIDNLLNNIPNNYILFTEINSSTDLSKYDILILNTIGILNKTYRYADWVYIGGGFGKSIHNIQEPAVFGVPIITGPKIEKFKEAVDLKKSGGLEIVKNQKDFDRIMDLLLNNKEIRNKKAEITRNYAVKNVGATDKILMEIDI